MTHPEELLAGFVAGSLSEGEREEVRTHLATCERCSKDVAAATDARDALRAIEIDACVAVPFRKSPTIGSRNQREMGIMRDEVGIPECSIHQDLPRRGVDQIVATNHFVHALFHIVNNDRELIRRGSVRLGDNKIAQFTSLYSLLSA